MNKMLNSAKKKKKTISAYSFYWLKRNIYLGSYIGSNETELLEEA